MVALRFPYPLLPTFETFENPQRSPVATWTTVPNLKVLKLLTHGL